MRRRAIAVVRALAVVAVLVVAAVTLGRGVERASEFVRGRTAAGERRAAAGALAHYACLERVLLAQLPDDATVRVEAADDASYQRLTEIATPHARVVSDPSRADVRISLVPGPDCGGTTVVVRP